MMLAILDGLKVMKVIVAGYIDFENAGEVREILTSARPHIEGALEEEGCIAYSWTECHLTPGRVYVFEGLVGHHLDGEALKGFSPCQPLVSRHGRPSCIIRQKAAYECHQKIPSGARGACLR